MCVCVCVGIVAPFLIFPVIDYRGTLSHRPLCLISSELCVTISLIHGDRSTSSPLVSAERKKDGGGGYILTCKISALWFDGYTSHRCAAAVAPKIQECIWNPFNPTSRISVAFGAMLRLPACSCSFPARVEARRRSASFPLCSTFLLFIHLHITEI